MQGLHSGLDRFYLQINRSKCLRVTKNLPPGKKKECLLYLISIVHYISYKIRNILGHIDRTGNKRQLERIQWITGHASFPRRAGLKARHTVSAGNAEEQQAFKKNKTPPGFGGYQSKTRESGLT